MVPGGPLSKSSCDYGSLEGVSPGSGFSGICGRGNEGPVARARDESAGADRQLCFAGLDWHHSRPPFGDSGQVIKTAGAVSRHFPRIITDPKIRPHMALADR